MSQHHRHRYSHCHRHCRRHHCRHNRHHGHHHDHCDHTDEVNPREGPTVHRLCHINPQFRNWQSLQRVLLMMTIVDCDDDGGDDDDGDDDDGDDDDKDNEDG